MTRSILRSAALAVVAIVTLAGCGGAANANEPAGAVSAALDAAESGGIAKVLDFTCAAKKGQASSLFGGLGSTAGLPGLDANAMLGAIKMDFQDIKTTETSKSGTNATVHVTGKAAVSFDAAKMKEAFKQMLAANGQPVDDATIDATIGAMGSSLNQTQPIESDVAMVQEGGKWLIC
jgi:hypothetical protein